MGGGGVALEWACSGTLGKQHGEVEPYKCLLFLYQRFEAPGEQQRRGQSCECGNRRLVTQ